MAVNPNYPTAEMAWGPLWNANAGAVPADRYVNLSKRTLGSIGAARGKQYELDQSQAGTFSAALADNDGALDPTNTAGPWAGHIKPYQPIRYRMQYPPCANLLLPGQASGGEGYATGAIPAALNIFSTVDPAGGQIVASGTAFQGANVFQFACGSGFAANSAVAWTKTNAVRQGATYTVSMRVRNVTASTTQGVKAHLSYYDGTGASVTTYGSVSSLVGNASAAWTTIQATFTAPASAYGMQCGFSVSATTVACSIQLDGWQLEESASASAWSIPSPYYPIFSGFVERWPTEWRDAGSFGVVSPTAVDAFALLSQRDIRAPLTEEIYARAPRFLYPLSDPQGSTAFADQTGNLGPAGIGTSRLGPGTFTAGDTATATDVVNGLFADTDSTVVTLTNANPGTNTVSAASYVTLPTSGPASATWTRGLAFRYTGPKPTYKAIIWQTGDPRFNIDNPSAGTGLALYIDTSGHVNFLRQRAGTSGTTFLSGGANKDVTDGNWHYVMFGYDNAGTSMLALDGVAQTLSAATGWYTAATNLTETVGAWPDLTSGGNTYGNFTGSVSYLAEWPSVLNSTAVSAIYSAWKTAFLGDSTDQRYARILGWAGYSGATDIGTGQTRSMSAAKGDSDAMSMLQAVVETESGNHWVAPNGAVTFRGRATRYNQLTPAYTFGERTDLGEYPYEELTLDYDSTHLANVVEVTQASTSQKFTATDSASQTAYFPRSMSRTVDTTDATEARAASGYLLSRYKEPAVRVTSLKLHPGANPSLWPVCLALEIGTRVRVMRRAGAAPAMQLEMFVEHIDWSFDDQNDAWLTLQLSPADPTPYGLFSAFHTTVNAAVAIGDPAFYINAPAGGTPAQLESMIAAGTQLVVDPGPNQETVTVLKPGVTTVGWTAASLFIVGTFAKTHPIGAAVYQVLPAGVTDPATWDLGSAFDAIAFSY